MISWRDGIMTELLEFEKELIDVLCGQILTREQRRLAKEEAPVVDFYTTGHGYFLTVRHVKLPEERKICDKPIVSGARRGSKDPACGFLVLLEDRKLTIECYGFREEISDDFRENIDLLPEE